MSSAKLRIDRIEAADVERVVWLFDQYRVYYEQPSDLNGVRTFLTSLLEKGDSVIFAAVDERYHETEAIGFTQLYPTYSSLSIKKVWTLNDLFVKPEARGIGAGRALIEEASSLARDTQAKGLQLCTYHDNYSAQRLYESIGFARDTEFYHYFLKV
jgi:ribosomal protein S18 acetylase RimI-like enzyme